MRAYEPNAKERWNGYFNPETREDVSGVVRAAQEAALMRNLAQPEEPETSFIDMIKEVSDIADMRAADGLLKSEIEDLRGSLFYRHEMDLLSVGLAMSAIWDDMEIMRDAP